MIEYVPYFLVGLKIILIITAVIFFISGLDDLFIDIYFNLRNLYRRLFILPKYQRLTENQLLSPPEQPIAVMIPAWKEADVIRRMLENTLRTFTYANYHIFVGTYPNDPDTQDEVEVVREKFDNVHRVVCPKNGPTNKADCLNWIFQGIKNFEIDNNMKFAIFVMEDAEDIVHPLALKLFNYLIPRKDMVQIPVFALECGWCHFTCGHYLDEFSENHYKNLVVREFFAHNIPSAGVGCAFSQRALESVAIHDNNQLFSINSLTEDYEIGLRLASYNLKTIFVKQAFERETYRKSFWHRHPRKIKERDYIGVREYFPKTFRAAVRQKSRWIVGIALQGWVDLGWHGDLRTKYMLYRDRKTLLTSQANMFGYFVVLGVLIYWFCIWAFPNAYHYPPLVNKGSWLYYLILADTFFMFVRLLERFLCVWHFYGWGQAFWSIPRFVWGNIINFAATTRAEYLFAKYLWTGKFIAWDKTDHVLPTEAELRQFRRKLGDLLLEKKFLTVPNLNRALQQQKSSGLLLGEVLLQLGLVKEDDLIQVLGMQLQLKTQEINPYAIPLEVIRALPRQLAVRYSLFPLELNGDKLVVASPYFLNREQLENIGRQIGKHLELHLTTRSDLAFAIRAGYQRLQSDYSPMPANIFTSILLKNQLVDDDTLNLALKTQRRSYRRLGDILLEQNVLTPTVLEPAIAEHLNHPELRLGEFLVQDKIISPDQLQAAMAVQTEKFLKLGDILFDMGKITALVQKLLNIAEAQIISCDLFNQFLLTANKPQLINNENLNRMLSIFKQGKMSSDIFEQLVQIIASDDIADEVLAGILSDLENDTALTPKSIQRLARLEADHSHAAK